MIPQTFIDDLLARADIVQVVERFVPLKKAGQNYSACCPFHQEKSPSFTVSPTKQFYHCFGCGVHGNALGFIMEYQGLGFIDAVKMLASEYGMVVPEERSERFEQQKAVVSPLLDVMSVATNFFKKSLKQSPEAIDYLKKRGLTGEIAARFELGFSPEDWQALATVFPQYETQDDLLSAGLVIKNEQGRRYDRFRHRVMFPIHNQKGQIIGFGGRVLGKGEPKYLNSPETPLFEKGKELYGLWQARQAIKTAGKVMVVEGYMDVVALSQFGVDYAVATLGTATTGDHIHKLLRYSERIIFCFDGDNAGRKAAWRALENLLPLLTDAITAEFLFLPEGEDPDTLVRQVGKDGFEKLLAERVLPLSRFLIQEIGSRTELAKGRAEDKAKFWHEIKPLLNQIAAPTLRNVMWTEARNFAGLLRPKQDKWQPGKKRSPPEVRMASKAPATLEDRLIGFLLQKPAIAERNRSLFGQLHKSYIDGAESQALLEFLQSSPTLKEVSTEVILQQFPQFHSRWQKLLTAEWVVSQDFASEEAEKEFADICQQIIKSAEWKKQEQLQDYIERKVTSSGLASLTPEEKEKYRELTLMRARR